MAILRGLIASLYYDSLCLTSIPTMVTSTFRSTTPVDLLYLFSTTSSSSLTAMCLVIINLRRNDRVGHPIDQRRRPWRVRLFRLIQRQMKAICGARRVSPGQASAILDGEASEQPQPPIGFPSRRHTGELPPPYSSRTSGARRSIDPSLAATTGHDTQIPCEKQHRGAACPSPPFEPTDCNNDLDDYMLFYGAANTAYGLLGED